MMAGPRAWEPALLGMAGPRAWEPALLEMAGCRLGLGKPALLRNLDALRLAR